MDVDPISYEGPFNESEWEIVPPTSEKMRIPPPRNPEPSAPKPLVRSRSGLRKTPPVDFIEKVQFYGGPVRRKKTFRLALLNWAAFSVDLLALFSIGCLAIGVSSILLNSHFMFLVKSVQSPMLNWTVIGIEWILYSSICRFFLGGTLGEWSCDLRCGLPSDRIDKHYVARCVFRGVLSVLPGFQILPLISFFVGKDLLGQLTGVQIYSLK